MPDRNFKTLFRFPKEVARELIDWRVPHLQAAISKTAVPAFLKMLAAFHFYGEGSYQSCIDQNYLPGMSQCTVSKSLLEVITARNNDLLREYIKFPQTNEVQEIKQRYVI